MAKKEDPAKVAQRKQERVAFVQANPQLAPEQARQRFFVQTRMNELAATGSLGDRKALQAKFQSGGVTREGFYTPADRKRIAANNASGPPGTDNTGSGTPPAVVIPTAPTVTGGSTTSTTIPPGSTTSTTMPKGSTTSTTTPTRATTNTTTTPNQYEQPTTTTALGQIISTTAPRSTTTTPAASTTKTSGGGFFDSGVGKFLKDTTTDNPNVGLQGFFNRNLPITSKVLQIPGDAIESMQASFINPAVNQIGQQFGKNPNLREAGLLETGINTAFTIADIASLGASAGFRAPVSAVIRSQVTKRLGKETVENIAAKTTAAKLAGKELVQDVISPVTQSPLVNRLGRGGREYQAEQLIAKAPKPLSSIPGAPGNPTKGAILDFGPTKNPTPPGRGPGRGSVAPVPVKPSRVKGRGAKPPAPALTVVEGVKPGTTEASMLNHPSYKGPDAPNLSLVPEDDFAFGLDSGISRSDEFGDGWFTPDDAPAPAPAPAAPTPDKPKRGRKPKNVVSEGKQGDLKAPTSTALTPEKSPTSSSNETTGAPIVNGKVQMPGTEPAWITELKAKNAAIKSGEIVPTAAEGPVVRAEQKLLAEIEADDILPSEIVNREKYDAFGNSTNNDPLIRRVGEEPAGQGPFDSPRSVGPQSLDQAKRRTRRQADPDADEAAAMITNDQLDRAGLENVPMGRLIKNNIEIIRADRATRNADLIRDYESRRYPTIDDMSGNPIPTPATNKPLEGVFTANGKVSKKFTNDPAVLAARAEAKKQVAAAGQLRAQTARKTQRVEVKAIQEEAVDVQKVVKTENQPLQIPTMSQPQRITVTPEPRERVNPPGVNPELSSLDVPVLPPIQFGVRTEPFPLTSITEYDTFVDVTKNPMTGQANQQSTIELARSLGRNESIPGQAATRGREFADGEFEEAVAELKTRRVNYEETGVMTAQHREVERKLRETFGGERFDKISAAASGQDVPVFRGNTPSLTQTLNMPDMPSGQSLSEFQQVFGRSAETPSAAPRLPELQTNAFAPYSPTNNPGRVRGASRDEQVASWRNLSTSKEFQQMMIDQPDLAAFIARQNKPFQDILERQAAADSVALEARLSSSAEDKAWATVQEASGGVNEAALRKIREGKDQFVGGPENVSNPLRGTEINPVDPSKQMPVYIQDWSKPSTWKTEFPRQNAIDMSRLEPLKRETVQSVAVQYDETQRVISQMTDLLRNRGGVVGDVALTDFDSAIIDELGAAGMNISQFRRGASRFNRANRGPNNLPYSNPEVTFPTSSSKASPLTPEQQAARNAAMDQPANWTLDPFASFNPPANNQVVLSDPASLSSLGQEFRVNFDALLERAPTAADFQKALVKSRKAAAKAEREAAKAEAATLAIQEETQAATNAWWTQAKPYFQKQEEIRQAADVVRANRPQLTQRMRMEQDQAQRIAGLEQSTPNNNTSGPMTVSDPGPAGTYDPLIDAHVFEWSNPLTGTAFRVETKYGPATDKTYRTIESQTRSYTLKSQTKENTEAAVGAIMEEERLNAAEILKDWMGG